MNIFLLFERGKRKSCPCNDRNRWFRIGFQLTIILIVLLLVGQYLYQNSSIFYRKTLHHAGINHLNQRDLILVKGDSYHLKVFGIYKWVKYSSTNFRVAEVDFTGRIHTFQPGKAFIIAKIGDKELKCRVRVIDLNKDKVTVKEGKSTKLRVRGIIAPVKWSSSNPEVAKVSFTGKVTTKEKGRAIISGKVKGKTLTCTVTVK